MGQAIQSISHMLSYAGELRREASRQGGAQPELAQKLQQTARSLETTGLEKAGLNARRIGTLLDLIA